MPGKKSPLGMFAARGLEERRKKFRWSDTYYKRRALGIARNSIHWKEHQWQGGE